MRLAISQSNYLPWRGYFAMARTCDAIVQFDGVQYTKRDWRNRNQILVDNRLHWLTVPVSSRDHYSLRIDQIEVADPSFGQKHWSTIAHAYAGRPGLAELAERIRPILIEPPNRLSSLNAALTRELFEALDITTRWVPGDRFDLEGDATNKLLQIATDVGASTYVSGPAAKSYLDVNRFRQAGIQVEFVDYSELVPHPGTDPLPHPLSIVHDIATLGLTTATLASRFRRADS